MTMINVIIADDEKHARERLRELLEESGFFNIAGEASTSHEAFEMIVTQKPDVAFLDIDMPGISIFDTISSLNDPPIIIFQTAYSEYAAEAFNINALDYLMKPLRRDRMNQAVQKIQERMSLKIEESEKKVPDASKLEKITVRDRGAIKLVQVKDILKICFEEGLCFIYTDERKFLSDKTLTHYEERLKDQGFFRSSRANLVNLDFIEKIHPMFQGSYLIELKDKSRVELSRRKAQILKKMIEF